MSENQVTAREIVESLPERFKPGVAEDSETLIHLKIKGDRGGDFSVFIQDGSCEVKEGLHGEANCVVTTTDKTYEDLEMSRINPQMTVFTGKLKVSNIPELLKFTQFFKRINQ